MSKIKEAISKALGLFDEDETEDKKEPKRESLRDRLNKPSKKKIELSEEKGEEISDSFLNKRFGSSED